MQATSVVAQADAAARYISLTLPVFDMDAPIGTITAEVTPDGDYRIPAASLLQVLAPLYAESELADLAARLEAAGTIGPAEADSLGLPIQFDPRRVALIISVPAEDRQRTVIEFGAMGHAPPPSTARLEPEDVSGYLNMNFGFVDDPLLGTGRTRGTLLLDSGMRLGGFVLENSAIVEVGGAADRTFSRRGTRLTRDFPKANIRASVGDVISSSIGFVGSADILGGSIFRNVEVFDPFQMTRPVGRQSFVITEPSNVDIYVNGTLIRQERLQPGTYDLANFPLTDGANDVRVEVVNDLGQSEAIDFTSYFNADLLAPGLAQWEINGGVRAERFDQAIEYDYSSPVVAAFYRRGMSNNLTLGANFKYDQSVAIAGTEAVAATTLANFSLDLAGSLYHDQAGAAVALAVRPNLPASWVATDRVIDGFMEYRTSRFGDYARTGQGGGLRTGLRYSDILLQNRLSFTATLGYNNTFSNGSGGFEGSASFAYRFANDIIARVTAEYRDTSTFDNKASIRLTLSKRFGRKANASGTFDTRRNRYSATYDYRSQYGGVGTFGASINASGSDQQQKIVDGTFNYIGNRFESAAGYTHTVDEGRTGKLGTVRANLATSIAFAGGSFAIGRPVRDSFAIVAAHNNLDDRQVVVGPGSEFQGDLARTGGMGPALVPGIPSYSLTRLPFDVVDLPPGYDLGTGSLEFYSPYRAGYSAVAGTSRVASLLGHFIAGDGTALGYVTGTATSETDAQFVPQQVFTNRNGRFAITGLLPGHEYRVVFEGTGTAIILRTPDDAEGFSDVGNVVVSEAK